VAVAPWHGALGLNMASTFLLEAAGLHGQRSGREVVCGVSVGVRAGEWLAVVGPNGAGKSSLLALLAGLHRPSQGQVNLAGQPLAAWPARERAMRLAWLGQAQALEGELSVQQTVLLARLPHTGLLGRPRAEDHAAVDAALHEWELHGLAQRRLPELSGGERQRVLLARALAVGAQVLLLDEPTTHLDAPHQRALVHCLRRLSAAGAAVVTVLHDLTLALAADRVAVLDGGRLVACAAPGNPGLHSAITTTFGHALDIQRLPAQGPDAAARYAVLPRL
jgi:iron complex transport system ATP-binding protein